jgi:prepilin-type N-terminal cleavage/methylation domain-containing protein
MKDKGFSLVELMVVLAALGGVALLVTKLGRDSMSLQSEAAYTRDYNDLIRESHFLISNPKSCKASLAGTLFSPKDPSRIIKRIELWTHGKNESRDKKKFFTHSKIGILEIDEISLNLSDDLQTASTPETVLSTTAVLKISLIKPKVEKDNNPLQDIEHSINISYVYDPVTGKNKIISCENAVASDTKETVKIWCGSVLNPCGPDIIPAVAVGKYENGKFTGVFEPTGLTEAKICKGATNQPATLTACP